MQTPHDRAVQAVSNVLEMTVTHLADLATKAHEASTRELAAKARDVVHNYLFSLGR